MDVRMYLIYKEDSLDCRVHMRGTDNIHWL